MTGIFVKVGTQAISCLVPASRVSLLHLTKTTTITSLELRELMSGKVICSGALISARTVALAHTLSPTSKFSICFCFTKGLIILLRV